MNSYEQQAREFLRETQTEYSATYCGRRKHFTDDKEVRDVWSITLLNPRGIYVFTYGDSLKNTEDARNGYRRKPSVYSVLTCLTKYEPEGNVDDFASEFGYTKPSEAIRVYRAVLQEWEGVKLLFNDAQIEKLREIQ